VGDACTHATVFRTHGLCGNDGDESCGFLLEFARFQIDALLRALDETLLVTLSARSDA